VPQEGQQQVELAARQADLASARSDEAARRDVELPVAKRKPPRGEADVVTSAALCA